MHRPCPHCQESIPVPPEAWQFLPPWQCSHCSGLFGVGESGLYAIPPAVKPLWPMFSWLEARRFGFHASGMHYVYAICYPSGMPFYVGKGIHYRVCQHVEETWTLAKHRWSEKHGIIISLADRNEAEWYHFLALVETDDEASAIEQAYIEKWGIRYRDGCLCNQIMPHGQSSGDLPDPPRAVHAVVSDRSPRMVHHPDLLAGKGTGSKILQTCIICGCTCHVPADLMDKVVQCPNCAHFWTPIQNKTRDIPIRFGGQNGSGCAVDSIPGWLPKTSN